ncbi:MAG TPA: hypothetical protein VLS45_08690, partial [Methylomicrobium sp.]|nr:hypothetical protein [Methylomicrobium sp.]
LGSRPVTGSSDDDSTAEWTRRGAVSCKYATIYTQSRASSRKLKVRPAPVSTVGRWTTELLLVLQDPRHSPIC